MQKIETFYGMKVQASKSIELEKYNDSKKAIQSALDKLNKDNKKEYGVFITKLEFVVTEEDKFGVKSLEERLSKTQLKVSVNKKEKETDRIFFLNESIDEKEWLHADDAKVKPFKYTISSDLSGKHCKGNSIFEMLLITCVDPVVSYDRRKLKISVTAYPTSSYSNKLKNKNKFTTGITYPLNKNIQLALDLD